jgi:predicted acetyltransferase
MIRKITTIDDIKPIFSEYLDYVSQFYEIQNHHLWREGALKNLQRYSIEEDRHIYIVMDAKSIIGFGLVNKHLRFNTEGFSIAEFYIQQKHGKEGHGRALAEHIFDQYRGNWEVAVSLKNSSARAFWKKIVSSYTRGDFMEKKARSFSGYGFVFKNI